MSSTTAAPRRVGTDLAWLDLVRVLAIVAVVMVHVSVPLYSGATEGDLDWWVGGGLNALSRWCVPVFVMVSGALLLQPARDTGAATFYRKRVRRIGVPLLFWTAFYLAYRVVVLDHDIDPQRALELVAGGEPYLQLYFLYVVAGLALLTPFLRVVTAHGDRRLVATMALVTSGIAMASQVIGSFAGEGGTNAVTLWLPYLGYYLLGYVLRDVLIGPVAAVLALGVVVLGALVTLVAAGQVSDYFFSFNSPVVYLMAVAAYLLIHRLGAGLPDGRSGGRSTPVRRLSDLSFGVFLVHPLFLNPLRDHFGFPDDPGALLVSLGAQLVLSIAASLVLTAVARRIPVVRALF